MLFVLFVTLSAHVGCTGVAEDWECGMNLAGQLRAMMSRWRRVCNGVGQMADGAAAGGVSFSPRDTADRD